MQEFPVALIIKINISHDIFWSSTVIMIVLGRNITHCGFYDIGCVTQMLNKL